jgi:hypothetical protein
VGLLQQDAGYGTRSVSGHLNVIGYQHFFAGTTLVAGFFLSGKNRCKLEQLKEINRISENERLDCIPRYQHVA